MTKKLEKLAEQSSSKIEEIRRAAARQWSFRDDGVAGKRLRSAHPGWALRIIERIRQLAEGRCHFTWRRGLLDLQADPKRRTRSIMELKADSQNPPLVTRLSQEVVQEGLIRFHPAP